MWALFFTTAVLSTFYDLYLSQEGYYTDIKHKNAHYNSFTDTYHNATSDEYVGGGEGG